MNYIGEQVRYYRKVIKGINQSELGKIAFGLDDMAAQSKISRIEKGTYRPSLPELRKLEDALEITEGTLVAIAKKMNEKKLKKTRSFLKEDQVCLSQKAFNGFPGLLSYIRSLEGAAQSRDKQLVITILERATDSIKQQTFS